MNEEDKPKTISEAWHEFVEATGYWDLMRWLVVKTAAALKWLNGKLNRSES